MYVMDVCMHVCMCVCVCKPYMCTTAWFLGICHRAFPNLYTDDGDSISLESITSDDPERNRLLDFYASDDRVHTPRSVSTQSSQCEDDEWVLVDRPKKESSTQTNVRLNSSQDMLRKISRAQQQELRQVRGQTCCTSHGTAKARYELVVKTQRLEMTKKMNMVEAQLKKKTTETDRKLRC